MKQWTGDDDLIASVGRLARANNPSLAIAAVDPDGERTALWNVDDRSTFEIGSISKALTGMMYSDALGRGIVTSTSTLGELLPIGRTADVASVTLGSLAVHRSGLPRLSPGTHPVAKTLRLWSAGVNPYGESLERLLEHVSAMKVGAPRPVYSNLGFQLLGHAVAAAADTPYAELLRDVHGRGFTAPSHESDLTLGDLVGIGRFGRAREPWVGEAIAPAGGVRASIRTMSRFVSSMLSGSARGMAALNPVSEFSRRVGIGAGWITIDLRGRSITWHNGATGGFRSWVGLDREAGVGAVVLSAGSRSVDGLGFRLLSSFRSPT